MATLPRSIGFALLAGVVAAGSAAAQTSLELIRKDPAGQYLLIKSLVQPRLLQMQPAAPDPQGYDIEGCWTPFFEFGEWTDSAGLAGDMIVRASETVVWRHELAALGYPSRPLEQAIERYESALLESGFAQEVRDRAVATFQTDLDAIRRGSPAAGKTRRFGGCGGPGPLSTLNHATVPGGAEVRFIPKTLHELCRVQKIDPDDMQRCNYWMTRSGPIAFFQGDIIFYAARWPDGAVARGRFDSAQYCVEVGCVATIEIRRP